MNPWPRERWSLGHWNAWAAAGPTYEERKARLEEVPEQYREQVLIHLKTVHALRKRHGQKRRYDEIKARMG